MGRSDYLARLALGRSAFQELDARDDSKEELLSSEKTAKSASEGGRETYRQRYDAKGRPINPSAEALNAAMRNAENAALSLVGIVERKDNADRMNELKFRRIREERETVLTAEHDAGENLELIVTILSITNYATETLIRRVQAGLYRPSSPFASIVSGGLQSMRHAGLSSALAILFPGAPAAVVHAAVRVLLGVILSTGVEYLSQWLIRQKMRRRTARRVLSSLYFACEALLVSVDVALLPLEYYAFAQRLGLAPTWPLLPNWRTLLPSDPASVHHFGWTSAISIPVLRRLCSPSALMVVQSSLWREQDREIPVGSQLTKFEYPENFNAPIWTVARPSGTRDPFGWVLYRGYIFRSRLMRFFGYTLEHRGHIASTSTKFESNRIPRSQTIAIYQPPDELSTLSEDGEGDGMHHIHRSTELAHLAPRHLANRLDGGYAKLLLLPLQALVVRTVAQSYLISPLPKTPLGLVALPHLYLPFDGVSPLKLLRSGGWDALGVYLSKLGLSLTLHAANSVGIFFLVYKLVRWQGRRNFDWDNSGTIRGMVYPMEGEE